MYQPLLPKLGDAYYMPLPLSILEATPQSTYLLYKYKPNYSLLPLALEFKELWSISGFVSSWYVQISVGRFLFFDNNQSSLSKHVLKLRPFGSQYQCQSNNLTYQINSIIFWVIIIGYAYGWFSNTQLRSTSYTLVIEFNFFLMLNLFLFSIYHKHVQCCRVDNQAGELFIGFQNKSIPNQQVIVTQPWT